MGRNCFFLNGTDQFGIEVCYIKLNSQINLPVNFLIQKSYFQEKPTWNIYSEQVFLIGAESKKWNWKIWN